MQSFPLWEEEDGEEQGPDQAVKKVGRRKEVASNERKKEGKKIKF